MVYKIDIKKSPAHWHDHIKPAQAATSIKRSSFSLPVIENLI